MQFDFNTMPTPKLVEFYNRYAAQPVKRFSDRKTAQRRCSELFSRLNSQHSLKIMHQQDPQGNARPAMQTSLKLDRTICSYIIEDGERVDLGEWPNAYQMWRQNPELMTSAQQDRLTRELYRAAKAGQRITVEINGVNYELVNVAEAQ